MSYWTIPEIWKGETCIILGGGPSLAQVDLELVKQHKVIAVNDAYKLGQWDCCYFKDDNWYYQDAFKDHPEAGHNGEHLERFNGLKITSCEGLIDEPDIKVLKRGRRNHLELDREFITHCSNAGAEALALAIMLGSSMILLAGFDMKPLNGKHNWHDNHIRQMNEEIYKFQFMDPFKTLAIGAKARGVEIINCTIGSALGIFPIVPIEEVLNADRRMRA